MQDFGKKRSKSQRRKSRGRSKTVIRIGGGRRRGYGGFYGRRRGRFMRVDPITSLVFMMLIMLMFIYAIVNNKPTKTVEEKFSMPKMDLKWLGFGTTEETVEEKPKE